MSPYEKFYKEVERLTDIALLTTAEGRAIMRKAGAPEAAAPVTQGTTLAVDLAGQYSKVQRIGGNGHSQYGTLVSLPSSTSVSFPETAQGMRRLADSRGIAQARLLVTVTLAGPSGSTMRANAQEWVGFSTPTVTFTGGNPSVALDSVGLKVSDWKTFQWTGPDDEERPAIFSWTILKGSGTSQVGLGLCQLQLKN